VMEKLTGCGTAFSHDEGCKNLKNIFHKKLTYKRVIICIFFKGMKCDPLTDGV